MVKVLVNGARGRMGREVVRAVKSDPALTLVGEADIGDNLAEMIRDTSADAVVEFTTASAGLANTTTILTAGARPIVGTSGFTEPQVRELQQLARERRLGGVIAPNFAVGAVLLMRFARDAAAYLPEVEIIELHHDGKADAPSGTALRTAELIGEVRPPHEPRSEQELFAGARGALVRGVRVHSVRLPGLVAHQEVILGGVGQVLTMRHDSISRESFMPGVCLACRRAPQLEELYFGLEHVMFTE